MDSTLAGSVTPPAVMTMIASSLSNSCAAAAIGAPSAAMLMAAAIAGRSAIAYETQMSSLQPLDQRDALLIGEAGEVMHASAAQTTHLAIQDVREIALVGAWALYLRKNRHAPGS